MSAADRALASVAPRHALRRARARAVLTSLDRFLGHGGYRGAKGIRAFREWFAPSQAADSDTIPDLCTLRARSRDLVRNAPLATGAINTVTTSVVGTGLKVQSTIDPEAVGLSEEEARAWERRAERIFKLWTRQADLTRIQTFAEIQDLVLRSQLESGDLLVVRRFSRRAGDLLGTKLQVIEADRISTPSGMESNDRIIDGVEIDAQGAPVRYWVSNRHPRDVGFHLSRRAVLDWAGIRAFTERGERNALHPYQRTRPGLHRGVPYLAPVIEPLKQLERYTEAEIAAAVIASFFTVFVKSAGGDLGLANESTAGTSDASETEGVDAESRDLKLGSGAILDLGPEESIDTANPMRPNAAFDPFVHAVMKQVGVALELPHDVLVKQFQASYSASRAAILEAWRFFKRRRQFLVSQLCQPVYAWVITEAVSRGMLDAPGFFEDPLTREAWLGTMWTGDPQGHVQPVQEVNALKARMEAGLVSYTQAVAEDSGGDFEMVCRQRARDRALLKDLDLPIILPGAETIVTQPLQPGTTMPGEQPPQPPNGPDTEEGEED